MKIKIMSFNIRIDVLVDGKYAWPYREQRVLSFIEKEKPDLLGIQEAGPHMVKSLKHHLKDYDIYVLPRDERGESTPVLVKKNAFKIKESHTIWLTETPHVPSNIVGSNHPRIATYLVLETKDGKKINFFNTHLDYTGDEVTLKQVTHLHTYIQNIEAKYQSHTIITGDFNSYPDTKTVKYLEQFYQSCFKDESTHQLTFHGFSENQHGKPIDYILFSKDFAATHFNIHHHEMKEHYLSDHYPITIILDI
jgi:endonuclease/exonuclease/phosphatase family metal-dependent hydrolase